MEDTLSREEFYKILSQDRVAFLDSAVNSPGGPAQKTTEDLTFYVRASGSDAADGLTENTAYATIQKAIDQVPDIVKHNIVIDVGEGTFAGFEIASLIVDRSATLIVQGALIPATVATGANSGVATGGSTTQIVDSGQSWTSDDLVGKLALVDGEYRFIWKNDGTTLELVGALGASSSGKNYTIYDHGTVINSAADRFPMAHIVASNLRCGFRTSCQVQDIMTTAGIVGVYTSNGSPLGIVRCRATGAYYGYAWQGTSDELLLLDVFADQNSTGILFAGSTSKTGGANRADRICVYENSVDGIQFGAWMAVVNMSDIYAINNGGHGVYVNDNPASVTLGDFFRAEGNGKDGINVWNCAFLNFEEIQINNNTRNGIKTLSVPFVDIDSGKISGNGSWGINLDTFLDGNIGAGSFVNAKAATLEISGNVDGGILLGNQSSIALGSCTGTNTGDYGVEVRRKGTCLITSATAITGATGDATVDGGATTLDWSTDFASDGDLVNNSNNFALIERED